jgi:hypothetical protein
MTYDAGELRNRDIAMANRDLTRRAKHWHDVIIPKSPSHHPS